MSTWVPSGGDREPTAIGRSLERVTRSLGMPAVDALGAVFGRWEDLVGSAIAAHAHPARLRDGVLLVVVDDPAWATQLRWLEHDLVTRFEASVGEGVVGSIDVRVARPRSGG